MSDQDKVIQEFFQGRDVLILLLTGKGNLFVLSHLCTSANITSQLLLEPNNTFSLGRCNTGLVFVMHLPSSHA